MKKLRQCMWLIPARKAAHARNTAMKRPKKTVLSPCLAKNFSARSIRSGRQLLKDQLDRNIATNGIGVGTDRVGNRDQFFAYGPLDSRQLDVQLDLKRKSATSCRSNPDFGGDNRGTCIEMLATCSPHDSGLEAGSVTRSEELFRIRSQVACAAHLPRHAQLHFECAIS